MDNEQKIDKLIALLQEMMQKDGKDKCIKRAAHTKGLGLCKGYFTVYPDLPEKLCIGLFKSPQRYPALIRFSNSNPKLTSDKFKDIRGVAIKLISDQPTNFVQDFILASCPRLPWGTWEEFYETLYWGLKNPLCLLLKTLKHGNFKKFIDVYKMTKHDTSPLDILYWSITPYALGNLAVKYVLIPTSTYHSKLPNTLTDSYLSDNMQQHLQNNSASFDFYVQLPSEHNTLPLNDINTVWSEEIAPLFRVGQIEIPPQQFKTPRRNKLMEEIDYSPANSLAEHKPLGEINEVRVKIYQELAKFRHSKNSTSPLLFTEKYFYSIK